MKKCLQKCLFTTHLADAFGMLRPVSAVIVRRGHQYLIVQKPRKEHAWQFPQGGQDPGENKIEAGIRELREECGEKLKVDIQPKPIGSYRYLFPADFKRHEGKKYIGAKVTFFLADYTDGDINLDPKELVAHGWVAEDNLIDYFDEPYYRVIEKILQRHR